MSKGSRRRREDAERVRRNWPFPDPPLNLWDENDSEHPRNQGTQNVTIALGTQNVTIALDPLMPPNEVRFIPADSPEVLGKRLGKPFLAR